MGTSRTLHGPSDLAVQFQMDIRTVNKRMAPVPPGEMKGDRKRWYLLTAAPVLLDIDVLNPARQRAELDAARTKKLTLENAETEGRLLDGDEVRNTLALMNNRVQSRLRSVPAAQATFANPTDRKRAEAAIRAGIDDALTELADDIFGSGAAVQAATSDDDLGMGGRVSGAEPGIGIDTWE